jgi:hypothetical protein
LLPTNIQAVVKQTPVRKVHSNAEAGRGLPS